MYRDNVCAFIFNESKEFLACQRIDGNYYQCVQGGIEQGDTDVLLAAQREIFEEVGLKAELLSFVQELAPPNGDNSHFRYELRPNANLRRFGYVGQQQRMLLFYMHSSDIRHVSVVPPRELKVPQEFSRVEWMPLADLQAKCSPEKAHIFKTVGEIVPPIINNFLMNGSHV